jgi:hypothetical protein
MKHSRRLMTAIPAALLGVTLAAATAACQPADRGGKSTAEVCTDLDNNLPVLIGSIEASPLQLGMYPDEPSPSDQAHIVDVTRSSYADLSTALRGEADYAADADTAAALMNTADGVDARAATINTTADVSKITDGNAVDISLLYPVCPSLLLDQKSG